MTSSATITLTSVLPSLLRSTSHTSSTPLLSHSHPTIPGAGLLCGKAPSSLSASAERTGAADRAHRPKRLGLGSVKPQKWSAAS